MMAEDLGVYLKDHLAGAQIAIRLLQSMSQQHRQREYRELAAAVLREIQTDDRMLREIIAAIAERPSRVKIAAGWIVEKIARFKLGRRHFYGVELLESWEMLHSA